MARSQWSFETATELSTALAAKKVSAVELAQDAILRIERHDAKINAICVRDFARALEAARAQLTAGVRDSLQLQAVIRRVLEAEPLAAVDYAEIVDADAFEPVTHVARPCYALLAVFIGKTRLIDNLYVEPVGGSEELAYHL